MIVGNLERTQIDIKSEPMNENMILNRIKAFEAGTVRYADEPANGTYYTSTVHEIETMQGTAAKEKFIEIRSDRLIAFLNDLRLFAENAMPLKCICCASTALFTAPREDTEGILVCNECGTKQRRAGGPSGKSLIPVTSGVYYFTGRVFNADVACWCYVDDGGVKRFGTEEQDLIDDFIGEWNGPKSSAKSKQRYWRKDR